MTKPIACNYDLDIKHGIELHVHRIQKPNYSIHLILPSLLVVLRLTFLGALRRPVVLALLGKLLFASFQLVDKSEMIKKVREGKDENLF